MTLSRVAAGARLSTLLAISVAAVMGALVASGLHYTLQDMSYGGLIVSLSLLPSRCIVAALVATVFSFIVLLANDFGALRYARATPPVTATLLASFCGYAVGNFIGFGTMSGGAVRYRIYTAAGVPRGKIARVTIYIAAAFGIGAAEIIGLGLAFRAGEIAQLCGIRDDSLRLIVALILLATVAVVISGAFGPQSFRLGPVTIELPSSRLFIVQVAVTVVDIVMASGALWFLLPPSDIDFPAFVVIYTMALSLGVLSHAPGGIGVFDSAILYAIGTRCSSSAVAAALVAYRAIYFLLPFAIATALLAIIELRRFLPRP